MKRSSPPTPRSSTSHLPTDVRPMLAQSSPPFDSDEHLFEIKWDGIRGLVWRDASGYRLISRHGVDLTGAFPELAGLTELPPGTILDGELIVTRGGRPSLGLVQSRHQLVSPQRIRAAARTTPATYVVFDQLYDTYRPLVTWPFWRRREVLAATAERLASNLPLILSTGVVEHGRALFEQVVAEQLEGIVAKRLQGTYRPGRRGTEWLKIKPGREQSKSLRPFAPRLACDARSGTGGGKRHG